MNRAKSLLVRSSTQSFFSVMMVVLLLSCHGNSPTEPPPPAPVPPAQVPAPTPPPGTTGVVWGYVQDSSGACIMGAVVEVLDGPLVGARSTQWSDVCGQTWDGDAYAFYTLPVNTLVRLRASKEGYRSQEKSFYPSYGSGSPSPSNFLLERE